MSIRLSATVELSDEQLARIADYIREKPRSMTSGPRGGSARPEGGLPDAWHLIEERDGVTYAWPEETDEYDPFRIYEGAGAAGTIRLAIGACERTMVRGGEREYFITGHISESGAFRPIAEFLATDDHERSGDTIAIIKGKDGTARMYDPADELPEAYSAFRVETYRDRVDKPHSYNKLGVVAGKDDVETMLGHTYIQAVGRLGIDPS